MALTYGMIGDRLSDLVAELRDIDDNPMGYHKASELASFINLLDSVRSTCDALSLKGLNDALAANDGS
jgi:hypothetical protein